MNDARSDVRVERLTDVLATELATELIAMANDLAWDYWREENLLLPRPEKWKRSLLATRRDRPVGWAVASGSPNGAYLHHIIVAPDGRSSGIGTLLMRELMHETAPGVLALKVHVTNFSAVDFYARLGFSEIELSPAGYRVLRCDLSKTEVQK